MQRTAETQHGQVGQQRFKINEVSRLSGHTFSCPGTGMGCRPQGPGPRICCLSALLPLLPWAIATCYLGSFVKIFFLSPCFDKRGRKTAESWQWEWERTGKQTTEQTASHTIAASCSCKLHSRCRCCCCCSFCLGKFSSKFSSLFRTCNCILSTFAIPFPFTCTKFQLITTGHKWSALQGGIPRASGNSP